MEAHRVQTLRLTDGGKVVSLMYQLPFTLQEDSLYSFLLEAELTLHEPTILFYQCDPPLQKRLWNLMKHSKVKKSLNEKMLFCYQYTTCRE
jgi:hypothetical protein